MRPPSRVAKRYASALFQAARRVDAVDAVSADLRAMTGIFEQHPQVLAAMAVPRVPTERKKAALQAIVGPQMQRELTCRFIDLMVDHSREAALPDTARAYASLADETRGVVNADVRTATPLDDGQTARLKQKLDTLTGRNTRLTIVSDPSLVGGMVVRIGDKVMDGSVKGYLEQFAGRLRSARLPVVEVSAG